MFPPATSNLCVCKKFIPRRRRQKAGNLFLPSCSFLAFNMIQPKQQAKNSQSDFESTWHTDRSYSTKQHFRVWRPTEDLDTSTSTYRVLLPRFFINLDCFYIF